MKKLPIGVSTFESLTKEGVLYVDKTEVLYQLIKGNDPKRYFLSRPRRFGKSLTCSTFAAIFSGNKELFKGLWIENSNHAWKQHPVIHLDFSGISRQTPDMLEKSLKKRLYDLSVHEDISLDQNTSPQEMLRTIIIALGEKKGPVCIIIDEYDKPIVDHIDNQEIAEKMRLALKEFYEIFKDAQIDANVHFLFVTGVSKFSKVSLFSGVNNLKDITMSSDCAALVGYSDTEVDKYLTEHITVLAAERNEPFSLVRQSLKTWYNGYRFSQKNITVYNPWSLHNCLSDRQFKDYWFSSGTPNFLIKWIKQNPDVVNQIDIVENEKVSSTEMDAFDVNTYYKNFKVLLLQTGYLTLGDYDEPSANFTVMYPNWEVRRAMTGQIMEFVGQISQVQFGSFIPKFRDALAADDIGLFCQHLQDFFTLIPHTIIVNKEKFYQGTFYMICRLFGGSPLAEVATHMGFIDVKLEGNKYLYIIEMKKDKKPDIALAQIESKGYAASSKIESKKPVILVGISFAKTAKGVTVKWKSNAG